MVHARYPLGQDRTVPWFAGVVSGITRRPCEDLSCASAATAIGRPAAGVASRPAGVLAGGGLLQFPRLPRPDCSWQAQREPIAGRWPLRCCTVAPGPARTGRQAGRQVAAAAQAPAPGQQAVQCHGSRQQGSLIAGMPPASSAPSGEPGASRPAGDCWHQSLAPPSGGLAHAAAAGWLPAAGASCPASLTCQPLEQD